MENVKFPERIEVSYFVNLWPIVDRETTLGVRLQSERGVRLHPVSSIGGDHLVTSPSDKQNSVQTMGEGFNELHVADFSEI